MNMITAYTAGTAGPARQRYCVAATQYLCLAGPACPAVFAVIMFLKGDVEAGVLALVLTALALYCHGSSIRGMFDGTTSRTDVIGALKKKLSKK